LRVAILAADHVRHAGITTMLESQEGLAVRPFRVNRGQDVIVIVANEITRARLTAVALARRTFESPSIVIADERIDIDFEAAIEAGVVSALHVGEATAERVVEAIGQAVVGARSPALSKALVGQVQKIRRFPVEHRAKPDLSYREITLLRQFADGCSTNEVARNMQLSERMVKYLLSRIMQRFDLRNRAHAVAFAIRAGVI
jgi:DNA-binding NarL/FixJ family response regulator